MNYRNVNIVSVTLLIALIILDWRIDISNWFYFLLLVIYIAIQTYGSMLVQAKFYVPIKCNANKNSKGVALTFDDGPLPYFTARVLDILKRYQVQAIFFCIGYRIAKHPEILLEIHNQGHIIGNHTYFHGKFFDLQLASQMRKELTKTDLIITKTLNKKPRFFRPPYGVTNPNLAKAIKIGNYVTIGWSVRSFDTITKDEDKLFARITKNLRGGDVILLHDFCESTIGILPRLIEHINKVGLKVVRLDELLNEEAYE